jgi:hypothetical protein
MKKTVLVSLFLLAGIHFAFSQDTLKAVKGKYTTELNVNPFQGDVSFNNLINQIKIRTFISDQYALRLAFNTDFVKNTNDAENVYGPSPYKSEQTQKSTTIGVNFGIEKHFTGTQRLSPYIGAEIFYVNKSSSQHNNSENTSGETEEREIDGAWYASQQGYTERGYNQGGLNLLAGFDYYIAKNFYFGYEMAWGYSSLKYKDIEVTYKPEPDEGNPLGDTDIKEVKFGAKLLNGIRLGFIF